MAASAAALGCCALCRRSAHVPDPSVEGLNSGAPMRVQQKKHDDVQWTLRSRASRVSEIPRAARLRLDHAALHADHHGVRTVIRSELREDTGNLALHRRLAR